MLCCETYSLHSRLRENSLTLEQIPELYKELEIPGIAWNDLYFTAWDNAYLDRLKQATAAAGRTSCAMIIEGNLATPDDDARASQIQLNLEKMKAAQYLGVPVVRINLGRAESEDLDETVGVERCIAAFQQMLPTARELGIRMTIENHGGPSRNADWILRIIKATDPEWVGSCLDFGNWPSDPPELKYESIAKLAPYAYHTHVKTLEFDASGNEVRTDYRRAFDILRPTNYQGAISIEWEGRDPADPVEGVRLSRDLVRRHWGEPLRASILHQA